jgi:AraC family transcriptional regulator
MRRPGIATQIMTELIAGQIAIEMFRHGAAITDGPTRGGLTPWRLRIIDERLAERCDAPTLAELAGLCDLSVRQLARGFRTSRGCSIGEYVARSQIGHAKRLLASDESIKSVAYTLGFASPSNFSSAFRRATGQTPREFRRSLRKH